MRYRLSHEARMDLARIYWHGVTEFGEHQAERYYHALIARFEKISRAPLVYPAVDDIREGYRRSVCCVDSIYYCVNAQDNYVEIMRVLGRQDTADNL